MWAAVCFCEHTIQVENGRVSWQSFESKLPGAAEGASGGLVVRERAVRCAVTTMKRSRVFSWLKYVIHGVDTTRDHRYAREFGSPLYEARDMMFGLSVSQQGRVVFVLAYGMLGGKAEQMCETIARFAALLRGKKVIMYGETGGVLVQTCRTDARPGRSNANGGSGMTSVTEHGTMGDSAVRPAVLLKRYAPAASDATIRQTRRKRKGRRMRKVDVGGIKVDVVDVYYVVRTYRVVHDREHNPRHSYRYTIDQHTVASTVARSQLFHHLLLIVFAHEQTRGLRFPRLYEDVPSLQCVRHELGQLFRRRESQPQ